MISKSLIKNIWNNPSTNSRKLFKKNISLYHTLNNFSSLHLFNHQFKNLRRSSRFAIRYFSSGNNNKNNEKRIKIRNIKEEDIMIHSSNIPTDRISDTFSFFKSNLKDIIWTITKNGSIGSVFGITIGSAIFIFSLKSMTLLAISFVATTILMTSLGIVKGVSNVMNHLTGQNGPFYRLLSLILDIAYEPLKKSEVGGQIIPIEDYNKTIKSSLKLIEDKLSLDNWFARKIVRMFTSKIESGFTKYTEGKENISISDSKDILISIILNEIKSLIEGRISLAIYAISFSQFLVIFLSFV